MWVHSLFRRRGVGKSLLHTVVLAAVEESKASVVRVETIREMPAAVAFYSSLGFRVVAERKTHACGLPHLGLVTLLSMEKDVTTDPPTMLSARIANLRHQVEAELSAPSEALEQAMQGVAGIRAADLRDVRALRHPPVELYVVGVAVAVLLRKLQHKPSKYVYVRENGSRNPSVSEHWRTISRMFGSTTFRQEIMHFDRSRLKHSTYAQVQALYVDTWDVRRMRHVALMLPRLAAWVDAQCTMHKALERVEPLVGEVKVLEEQLQYEMCKQQELELQRLELEARQSAGDG